MKYIYVVVAILVVNISYSQAFDIEGMNRDGTIFYKDGSTASGKLTYKKTTMTIKMDGGKRQGVAIDEVDRFDVYKKKDTISYTYVLSKRNYKKKKLYLCGLMYDGEKVRVYNEPTTAARVGAFSISQPVYFIQKKEDPYAIKVLVPFKNPNDGLKEFFKVCPDLSEKIGSTLLYKNYKSLVEMVDYYEHNCK